MARVRMITRTVTLLEVNVLCLNLETGEPFQQTVRLPKTYRKDLTLLKRAAALIDSETVKACKVMDDGVEIIRRYGMTEAEFLVHAREITDDEAESAE